MSKLTEEKIEIFLINLLENLKTPPMKKPTSTPPTTNFKPINAESLAYLPITPYW